MDEFFEAMGGGGAGPMMDAFQGGGEAFGTALGGGGGLEAAGDAFMDTIGTALDGGAVPGITMENFEEVADAFMDSVDFSPIA